MPPAVLHRPRASPRPRLTRSRSAASLSRTKPFAAAHLHNARRLKNDTNNRPQYARPAPTPPNLVRSKSASSLSRRSRASSRRHIAPPAQNRQRAAAAAAIAATSNAARGGPSAAKQRQSLYANHPRYQHRAANKAFTPPASQYHLQPVALNATSANAAGGSSIGAPKRAAPIPILRNNTKQAVDKQQARHRLVRWNLFAKNRNTTATPPPTARAAPTVVSANTVSPTAPNPALVQYQLRQQQQRQRLQKNAAPPSATSAIFRQSSPNSLLGRPGNNNNSNNNALALALRSNNLPPYQGRAAGKGGSGDSLVRYNAGAVRNGRTVRSIRYQGTAPNGMAMRRVVNYSASRSMRRPMPMDLFGSSGASSGGNRMILLDGRGISDYDNGMPEPIGWAGVMQAIKYYHSRQKDWIILADDISFRDWEAEQPEIVYQLSADGKLVVTPPDSAYERFLARIGVQFEADIVTNNDFFMEKENQIDPMLLRSSLDRLVIPFMIFRQTFIPHPEECRILEGLHSPKPPVPQLEDGGIFGDDMGVYSMGPGGNGQFMQPGGRGGGSMMPGGRGGGSMMPGGRGGGGGPMVVEGGPMMAGRNGGGGGPMMAGRNGGGGGPMMVEGGSMMARWNGGGGGMPSRAGRVGAAQALRMRGAAYRATGRGTHQAAYRQRATRGVTANANIAARRRQMGARR